jgi:hypothetical protein
VSVRILFVVTRILLTSIRRYPGFIRHLSCSPLGLLSLGKVPRRKDDLPAYPQTIYVVQPSVQASRSDYLRILHRASRSRIRVQHYHLLSECQGDDTPRKRNTLSPLHHLRSARLREYRVLDLEKLPTS